MFIQPTISPECQLLIPVLLIPRLGYAFSAMIIETIIKRIFEIASSSIFTLWGTAFRGEDKFDVPSTCLTHRSTYGLKFHWMIDIKVRRVVISMDHENTITKILDILKEEHLSMRDIKEVLHALLRRAEDSLRL